MVILFPLALIWLVLGFVWIIRNSSGELDEPAEGDGPKRIRPRRPPRPTGGRSRSQTGASARR